MTDTTNLPTNGNNEPGKDLSLESLTDQNWLFIKHFLETGDIRKAYQLAKYEGDSESAPYQVFKRLKPFIEEIGNMAVTSRLKLVADVNKALSLPLNPDKTSVSVSEWLRIRKFAASLTPEAQSQPKLSVLVVNRYGHKDNEALRVSEGNNLNKDPRSNDVIEVDPLP
jgi:hypothetical protein